METSLRFLGVNSKFCKKKGTNGEKSGRKAELLELFRTYLNTMETAQLT